MISKKIENFLTVYFKIKVNLQKKIVEISKRPLKRVFEHWVFCI